MGAPKDPEKYKLWKERLSAAHKRENLSPETLEKMAASKIGKKLPVETKDKMSKAHKRGNIPSEIYVHLSIIRIGTHHTVKTRAKMAAAHKRENLSPETLEKMAVAHKRENLSPERIAKMVFSFKGENNPAYIDGSCMDGSSSNYHKNFTKFFRELIRDKNDHRCGLCNKLEEKFNGKLHVHHIFYDEETNDCSNSEDFISLCRRCHGKTSYNRDYWVNYFLDQIYFPTI